MSNFVFLKEKYKELAECGEFAEKYLYSDPNSCIIKLGQFAETLVNYMMAYENISKPYNDTHANRIKKLKYQNLLSENIDDILYRLRKKRNAATHAYYNSGTEAEILVEHTHTLAVWFMQVYGDYTFDGHVYEKPEKRLYDIKTIQEQNKSLEQELENLKTEYDAIAKEYDKKVATQRLDRSRKLSQNIQKSEAQTRDLIDEQLRNNGWLADTKNIRYSKGVRPEKGKNLAIAEWKTNSILPDSEGKGIGAVDYALFVGLKLVGFIEAKKFSKDIPSVIDSQGRDYAANVSDEDKPYIIKQYGEFGVPFIFATNGRPFYKELRTKSGVWFLDLRDSTNHAKPLKGFYSPDDLLELLEKDIENANRRLEDDKDEYLKDENGLNLRDYQFDAVKAVEKGVLENRNTMLLSMATGTGKTRVALGIIYKLLRSDRFNRVLFVVDRTSLGGQAEDKFNEVYLENALTLKDIYGLNGLKSSDIDMTDKVHVATVQSLVRKILYNEGENVLTPGNFDLIIIDEAHRGYTLEKEMDADDILYRNQLDYQSKYRQVIEYFDAVKIGLTATPALHTTEIFGKPIFNYTYRQAVVDGYLIDHDPPHNIITKFNTDGIKYIEGETLALIDPLTNEIINSDELEDEVKFEVENFNRKILAPSFNRTVLEQVANMIDPDGDEKTLIFAVNDSHADEIVATLKDIYGDTVNDKAIRKITGQSYDNSKHVLGLINQYKNDVYPTVAVTVDLLTTGIDVPEITTLVFMRRVKSRILFEQMIGRATRLCPEINKTHFSIIDAVRVYESLERFSNMKPVTTRESMTIQGLIDELDVVTEDKKKANIEQIIAKVHRKKHLLSEDDISKLKGINDGKSIEDIVNEIKTSDNPVQSINTYIETIKYIEGLKDESKNYRVLSTKEDTYRQTTRGYGDTDKPEDYLESFEKFINDNKDLIPALNLVCTNPTKLTRKDLIALKFELDQHNFTEANLQTAYKDVKNVDIVADIISYIRNAALSIPIISHEARVKTAIASVKKAHDFNKRQMTLIDRIEKTLLKDEVLDMDMLDSGSFKSQGGVNRLDKLFDGNLECIVNEINEYLYKGE